MIIVIRPSSSFTRYRRTSRPLCVSNRVS
jgi:hypothetical protein